MNRSHIDLNNLTPEEDELIEKHTLSGVFRCYVCTEMKENLRHEFSYAYWDDPLDKWFYLAVCKYCAYHVVKDSLDKYLGINNEMD